MSGKLFYFVAQCGLVWPYYLQIVALYWLFFWSSFKSRLRKRLMNSRIGFHYFCSQNGRKSKIKSVKKAIIYLEVLAAELIRSLDFLLPKVATRCQGLRKWPFCTFDFLPDVTFKVHINYWNYLLLKRFFLNNLAFPNLLSTKICQLKGKIV